MMNRRESPVCRTADEEPFRVLANGGFKAVRVRQIRAVLIAAAVGAVIAPAIAAEPYATNEFDVVVYGATAGGAMAATAAGQMGLHVALLDPGTHVGGMVSGGLSHTDVDRQENLIGGLTLTFFRRVAARYGQTSGWSFEPHVAEETFRALLKEANVQIFSGEQIEGIEKQGTVIDALRTTAHQAFKAAVFIDSSYEGDLMAAAGVSYTVGREGRAKYGESLAGRMDLLPSAHQFATPVLADGMAAGDDWHPDRPRITAESELAMTGKGDGRFQSYCYRLILTDDAKNRIPIPAPQGYDPANYQLLKRYIESNPALTLKGVLGINRIPNGKADVNSNGPVSLDFLGANTKYPDANPKRRKEIAEAHLRWAQGLVYFLQNDPSVPEALQESARAWGLPKDEFEDTGHWPNQLYVREGRRMLGEYILTQKDLQQSRTKPDAIGLAGYNIDIREVQWLSHAVYTFPSVHNQMFTEGYLSQPVDPWQIPYRALLPKADQASNLLVTSCISASTIAYASFRVEPTYMIAGESAGVAAAVSIQTHSDLHQLNISKLQATLQSRGQILSDNSSRTNGREK
jgi:hypothetical protein